MRDFDDNDMPMGEINFVADFDGDLSKLFIDTQIDEVPIIPLRDNALFPGVVESLELGRECSLKAAHKGKDQNIFIGVLSQKLPNIDIPHAQDFHPIGTLVRVIRLMNLPGRNTETAIVQGLNRFDVLAIRMHGGVYYAQISLRKDTDLSLNTDEFRTIVNTCREMSSQLFDSTGMNELNFALDNMTNQSLLLNFCANHMPTPVEDKITVLQKDSMLDRGYAVLCVLNKVIKLNELRIKIERRTNSDLSKQQHEYFLQQQMRNIQRELNGGNENADVAKLKKAAKDKKWPTKVKDQFYSELEKLNHVPNGSPDYNLQLNYLESMVSLPWQHTSIDTLDLTRAQKILNRDHYGLEKVKERILEHLAVVKLRDDMKSPILCLYGPPGVGKTSLGRSIAEAMGRKYVRMSLGGLSDEAEIRGHRRTYIGAMMGRVLKNIQRAGTANPVFVLDEIDKVTAGNHGDPFSALLEVLDPEQNSTFHDNYLDIDYDLSKVMFIATANNISNIPAPLRDRMEMIEVSGYLAEEKIEIAHKHLIPKIKEELGLGDKEKCNIKLSKSVIGKIIENYTMESGVRTLEKQLGKLFRKEAYRYVTMGSFEPESIKAADLQDLLGTPIVNPEKYEGNNYAGVVTGLAWTSVGGTILTIEVSLSKGTSSKLTLTGSLGDVMKESAVLAVEYIKSHAHLYQIDPRVFDHWNIHIHVPDGATPKDGPSAGITLTTALISALTQRKVRSKLAMTGEITLRGKVTAVGGIREKILAAKRAGITNLILSDENRPHIEEIPAHYVAGLNFVYVKDIKEVIDFAILPERVNNALELSIPEETKKEAK